VNQTAKVAKINLRFSIAQDFKDIYNDLNNTETKNLTANITNEVICFSYEAWIFEQTFDLKNRNACIQVKLYLYDYLSVFYSVLMFSKAGCQHSSAWSF